MHETTANHYLGRQSLMAQLCIEMATDVPTATSQEENWTRLVIGRCVKVGIELRFLSSLDAPLRIVNPGLSDNSTASDKVPTDCTFDFNVETVLLPELKVRIYIYIYIGSCYFYSKLITCHYMNWVHVPIVNASCDIDIWTPH